MLLMPQNQKTQSLQRKGNKVLRETLVNCAHSAVNVKDSFFRAQFSRISAHRGSKRAYVAVAHSMLIAIYHPIYFDCLALHLPSVCLFDARLIDAVHQCFKPCVGSGLVPYFFQFMFHALCNLLCYTCFALEIADLLLPSLRRLSPISSLL